MRRVSQQTGQGQYPGGHGGKVRKKKEPTSLKSLHRSELFDDPIVGPIVDQFVQTLPTRVAALRDAECRLDWREVSSLAHQLAGSSGGYGYPEMGRVAARLEAQVKAKAQPKDLSKSIARFAFLCDAAAQGNHSTQ